MAVSAGARVRDSVVWEGAELGPDCLVEGALVSSGVRVGAHARVLAGAVLGEGTVVSDHSRTR